MDLLEQLFRRFKGAVNPQPRLQGPISERRYTDTPANSWPGQSPSAFSNYPNMVKDIIGEERFGNEYAYRYPLPGVKFAEQGMPTLMDEEEAFKRLHQQLTPGLLWKIMQNSMDSGLARNRLGWETAVPNVNENFINNLGLAGQIQRAPMVPGMDPRTGRFM